MHLRDERGQTPLFMASDNGHALTVRVLLRHGADVNVVLPRRHRGKEEEGGGRGGRRNKPLLRRHGADVNDGFDGMTPLVVASLNGHTGECKLYN